MRFRVLGCSGGIGGSLHTTAFLVDEDILIDAGTGVTSLSLDELCRIDHVFITHSHLDHIASLPLLIDSVARMRTSPLIVYATEATLAILTAHVFNWMIWPDFTRIPNPAQPFLRFKTIEVGKPVKLGTREITPIHAEHVVPAVGFLLDSGNGSLIFSGDTTSNDALWDAANEAKNLRYLVVETAFPDSEAHIATASKHLCPSALAQELRKLKRPVEVLITHLKPGDAEATIEDIKAQIHGHRVKVLQNGQVLDF